MKKISRQSRTRLQSLDATELARVSGGVVWEPGLDIMGGCIPTKPVPEPYPYPAPSPFPIPIW
jgi:hypothetical protein